MNTEDFCTYEQALALANLGFDKCCTHYYDERIPDQLQEVSPRYFGIYNISYDFNYSEHHNFEGEDMFKDYISAPTLAQAQKWLLKNKQHYVCPEWDIDKDLWAVDIKTKDEVIEVYVDENPFFNSYEEALSNGITECLKTLEK